MQAEEIFLKALDRPPAERRAYLNSACGEDVGLRAQVDGLLEAHEQAGSFLNGPLFAGPATVDQPALERPGVQIGPYKLLQQIGEGGFGVVFMAEQSGPVRRRVALKVIKPGMDTRQVIARFEAERQALAMMDHPNIARVMDAGATASGRPFFVMELVRGVPITAYCDQNNLPIRERLTLFVAVCQAIQHAHQKGIIHRDIKPSNVLVTSQDGSAAVKIIDFGVAKAMGQQLTDKTLFTDFAQMIGTPLYMSPEQAELSGSDIDTRSDIYSLGVVLYELLTGSTPVDKEQMKQAAFDEIRRLIREEEPQKPSTRISSAQAAPSIAAQRHTEPARLAKLVRGELDWIVMKALEKDRNRRYETATGLAADVLHYLADEPVLACPPSVGYRLQKFARRNKAALATAAIVAAALVLGIAVSTSQAVRASNAENRATGLLVSEKQATAKEAAARQEAEANLGKARRAVQQMLTRVAEERLAYLPQVEEVRSKLLEDALHFYEELLQQADVDPEIRLEAAIARLRVGNMARVLGRHHEAEEHCRAAVAIMQGLCREQPASEQFQLVQSDAQQGLGEALATDSTATRTTETEQALHEAIRLRSDLAVRSPQDPDHRQRQSVSYRWLAIALKREPSRQQDAAAACQTAIDISQRLVAEFPSSPDYQAGLASGHYTLCTVLDKLKQPEAAREHLQTAIALFERLELAAADTPASLRRELGTTHQGLAAYRHDLAAAYCRWADCLAQDGEREQAAAAFKIGLAIYDRLVTDFPAVPFYRKSLAGSLSKWSTYLEAAGDKAAAEAATRRVIELYREQIAWAEKSAAASGGAAAEIRAWSDQLDRLGTTLLAQFRMAESADAFRQNVEALQRLVATPGAIPDDRLRLEAAYTSLGFALKLGGHNDEAIAAHRQGLALAEKLTADFPQVRKYRVRPAVSHWRLARMLRASGRQDEAEEHYQQVLAFYERHPDRPDPSLCGEALIELAHIYLQRWQSDKAAENYERVLKIRPDSAYENYYLAWLLANCEEPKFRDPGRAVEFATKAVEQQPGDRSYLIVLGMAQYRAGDWQAASEALQKSTALGEGGDAYAWLFLAMAQWQAGRKEEARQSYNQAVEWMDKNAKNNLDLRRFRAEAEELMSQPAEPSDP